MNRVKAVLFGCAILILVGCGKGPSSTYKDFMSKASKNEWASVYDILSTESQKVIDDTLQTAVQKCDPRITKQLIDLRGKALFIKVGNNLALEILESGKIVEEKDFGNTATLTVLNADGSKRTVTMSLEGKQWKVGSR